VARPDVQIKTGIERRLARMRGVRKAVRDVGKTVLTNAKTNAAEHRDSGDYADSLALERGDVDVHVVAHDPAAVLIEHGYTTEDGQRIEGQKILTRAAADAVTRR